MLLERLREWVDSTLLRVGVAGTSNDVGVLERETLGAAPAVERTLDSTETAAFIFLGAESADPFIGVCARAIVGYLETDEGMEEPAMPSAEAA